MRKVKSGIFRRKVVAVQKITNFAIYQNDLWILLTELFDITVLNIHRRSVRNFMVAAPTGRYGCLSSSLCIDHHRMGQCNSVQAGDIIFIRNDGKLTLTFKQIADPYGIVELIKAARIALERRLLFREKAPNNKTTISDSAYNRILRRSCNEIK